MRLPLCDVPRGFPSVTFPFGCVQAVDFPLGDALLGEDLFCQPTYMLYQCLRREGVRLLLPITISGKP